MPEITTESLVTGLRGWTRDHDQHVRAAVEPPDPAGFEQAVAGLLALPPRPWNPPGRKRRDDALPLVRVHLGWLRLRGLSENTVYNRGLVLGKLAAALPVPLLEAAEGDLMAWRAALAVGRSATLTYTSHVHQFFEQAVAEGLRDGNPAARLPRPRRARTVPRPISEADLMTAMEDAPQPIRIWLVLANWCGLRCCEIAGLRRESIMETADPPVLIVNSDATKGNRGHVVPLCDFAVAEIRDARLPLSGYAFRRLDGQPGPNTATRVSHLIADYLHDLGIAATAHMGRHRYGTKGWQAEKDLLALSRTMGHAHISSTTGYTEFDNASAIAMVQALPVPPPRLRVVRDEAQ